MTTKKPQREVWLQKAPCSNCHGSGWEKELTGATDFFSGPCWKCKGDGRCDRKVYANGCAVDEYDNLNFELVVQGRKRAVA